MIESLKIEQWKRVADERERWRAVGLCTDPADRVTTERVISGFYRRLGKEPPRFSWLDGPLACCVLGPSVAAVGGLRLDAQFSRQLRDQLHNQLRYQLHNQIRDQLHYQLYDQLYDQLYAPLRDQFYDQLSIQLSNQLDRNQLSELARSVLALREWGAECCWWVAWFVVLRNVIGVQYTEDQSALLDEWSTLTQSAGWWFPAEDVCFCAERHKSLNFDERRNLHCETGPAIECRDGFRVHAWHGTDAGF